MVGGGGGEEKLEEEDKTKGMSNSNSNFRIISKYVHTCKRKILTRRCVVIGTNI